MSLTKKLSSAAHSLLIPIHQIIEIVLPDFIKENLRDDAVRAIIVNAVDQALVKKHPSAKAVPEKLRKKLILRALETVIDDILLGDETP